MEWEVTSERGREGRRAERDKGNANWGKEKVEHSDQSRTSFALVLHLSPLSLSLYIYAPSSVSSKRAITENVRAFDHMTSFVRSSHSFSPLPESEVW